MLQVAGYVHAGNHILMAVQDFRNAVDILILAGRQGGVDVKVMGLTDMGDDIFQRFQLCQRFSAGKNNVVVRENPVQQVQGTIAAIQIKAGGISIFFLVHTEWTAVVAVIRYEHGDGWSFFNFLHNIHDTP